MSSSPPIPTTSGQGGFASDTSSPRLLLFEVIVGIIFAFSFVCMKRRRRQLEARTEQRYERLSRIELGPVDVPLPTKDSGAVGSSGGLTGGVGGGGVSPQSGS